MKIESYLPVFPGFYGTLFEPYDEELKDDECDYQEYYQRVALDCTKFVEKELQRLGFDVKVSFQQIISPREYNFGNDSINCEYSIQSLRQFKNYLTDNRIAFMGYLHENYTSYDGFASFHSTDYEDWLKNIDNTHKFGAILNFIFENEMDDPQEEMFSSVETYVTKIS